MKTAVHVQSWASGGRRTLYNPTDLDSRAARLVRLTVDVREPEQAIVCGHARVGVLIDGPKGSLPTLVNWTNAVPKALSVSVRLHRPPISAPRTRPGVDP